MDLEKNKITATLVFPIQNGKVLLGRKVRKIGAGLWNGWGGRQKAGEMIKETAQREFREESGLCVDLGDLYFRGKVVFHNQKDDGFKFDVEVTIFVIFRWSGELKNDPKEMRDPTFWPLENLPFHEMMPSDQYWLPPILADNIIQGEVWHGPDQAVLIQPPKILILG